MFTTTIDYTGVFYPDKLNQNTYIKYTELKKTHHHTRLSVMCEQEGNHGLILITATPQFNVNTFIHSEITRGQIKSKLPEAIHEQSH